MTRAEIEAMTPTGLGEPRPTFGEYTEGFSGWDADLPGPIADSRWKMYTGPDGMTYALMDNQEKYKCGNIEGGIPWMTKWTELDK